MSIPLEKQVSSIIKKLVMYSWILNNSGFILLNKIELIENWNKKN